MSSQMSCRMSSRMSSRMSRQVFQLTPIRLGQRLYSPLHVGENYM